LTNIQSLELANYGIVSPAWQTIQELLPLHRDLRGAFRFVVLSPQPLARKRGRSRAVKLARLARSVHAAYIHRSPGVLPSTNGADPKMGASL
jgi:hypothetical protein